MNTLVLGLAVIMSVLTGSSAPIESPSPVTSSSVVLPTCEGDELCFTFESEERAYELFETFEVLKDSTIPHEVIYLGYYDSLPYLDSHEGYLTDPETGVHHVFAVFPDTTYTQA